MKKLLSLSTVALTLSIGLSGMAQAQSTPGASAKARYVDPLDDEMIQPVPMGPATVAPAKVIKVRPAVPQGDLAKPAAIAPVSDKSAKVRYAEPFDDDLVEPPVHAKPVAPAKQAKSAPAKPAKLRSSDPLGELANARSSDPIGALAGVHSSEPLADMSDVRSGDSLGDVIDTPLADPIAELANGR